jgi:putative ABC transport system substrate-binding protein
MKRREFIALVGGAAAWPLAAHAQQQVRNPRVGVLWHAGSAEEEGAYFKALLEGFNGLGYVEGRNITLEHRFPNETPDRFRSMAAELVSSKVDVLVSVGVLASPYAKSATTTIPVVFTLVADPVGTKLVDSLARPGGNATGLSLIAVDLIGKRMQFLKEIDPELSRIALLVNPNEQPTSRLYIGESQAAAAKLGLTVQTFEARSIAELEPAFVAMANAGMRALTVGASGMLYQGRAIVAKLAIARRLPICVWSRETLEAGALMSYGADQVAIMRRTAVYVDKILKGAKPADLPVEQPTRLQLLVNLKTAKALDINVPATLLAQADDVIE